MIKHRERLLMAVRQYFVAITALSITRYVSRELTGG